MATDRRTRVLITGATDGIGLLLAKSYASRGIGVLATGRRNLVDQAEFFANDNIHYIRADQSDPARAATAIARALDQMEWDALDLAILNAGIGWQGAAEVETQASIAAQIDINVTGTVLTAHAAAPALLKAGGRLAIIGSSLAGGAEGFATYAATKGALAGFARSLREEWRGRAYVTLVHPGPTKTDMHDKAGMTLGAARNLFMAPHRACGGHRKSHPHRRQDPQTGTPLLRPRRVRPPEGGSVVKALITGAAAGLGRALTDALLADGHEVVALDRDVEDLEALALSTRGACIVRKVDLADRQAVVRCLATLHGMTFDLVVLNAGISATGRFEDIPATAYKPLIDVNLTAPVLLSSGLMGAGLMAKGGCITFISSLSHVTGYPGAAVYAGTKDGLAIYARSVRKGWKKQGVNVMTVFPGPIRTAHAERYAPPGASAKKRMAPEALAAKILAKARKPVAEFYPGGTGARMAAWLAPNLTLRMLRRALYDKLDEPRF